MQSGILVGVDKTTLQTWLTQAQNALQALMTGTRAVMLQHGDLRTQFTQADSAKLQEWILELQAALGTRRVRRALRPYFR